MTRKCLLLALYAVAQLAARPAIALALDCGARGATGLEQGRAHTSEARLNPDESFSKTQTLTALYGELIADCSSNQGKLHLNGYGERIGTHGKNGIAQQPEGYANHGFIREAYLSLSPDESLFIDVGKKDIRNGQFFFVSPLDFLQNPSIYSSRGVTNGRGVSWRDTYREGSLLTQASWFNQYGTLEMAIIPKLANPSSKARISEWSTLQRSNSEERYYAAFTSAVLDDFNPRVVVVAGDSLGAGVGTSGFLTDDWILNLELAVTDRSHIRQTNPSALRKLKNWQLPSANELFIEQQPATFGQFAAGVRYTTVDNLAISLEYLFQEQGLNKRDWDDYFDFLDTSEKAYQVSGADVFRGYTLLFAQEADNNARRDLMLGRQYAMVHIQRDIAELRTLSWEASTIYNIDDHSYALNAHVSSQLSRNFEVYLGGAYLGGPGKSEFGRLATSGVGYAGIRAIW
jgi:hypothetical protein